MLTNPGAHELAVVPGGIIPDQQPRRFALTFQVGAAPVQKLRRDAAHRTAIHEAQRHLIADRSLGWPTLPQHPITRQGFGVGVRFLPALLNETQRGLFGLPAMGSGQGEAAPPDLIEKADRPGGRQLLVRGPGQQSIASVFFSGTAGRDW